MRRFTRRLISIFVVTLAVALLACAAWLIRRPNRERLYERRTVVNDGPQCIVRCIRAGCLKGTLILEGSFSRYEFSEEVRGSGWAFDTPSDSYKWDDGGPPVSYVISGSDTAWMHVFTGYESHWINMRALGASLEWYNGLHHYPDFEAPWRRETNTQIAVALPILRTALVMTVFALALLTFTVLRYLRRRKAVRPGGFPVSSIQGSGEKLT